MTRRGMGFTWVLVVAAVVAAGALGGWALLRHGTGCLLAVALAVDAGSR